MNVNMRELENHIEFEPNTYYASFSAELELSASPMWAILAHLKAKHHLPVLYRILKAVSTWGLGRLGTKIKFDTPTFYICVQIDINRCQFISPDFCFRF